MAQKPNLMFIGIVVAGVVLAATVMYWLLWHGRVSTDNAYIKADTTLISPRITGYVRSVTVGDNSAVKPGDVLVEIDDADYAAKVAAAQANVEALESQINEQVQVIAQASARAGVTWKNRKRAETLEAEGAIAHQNADEIRADSRSNQAVLDAAKVHLGVLEAQLKQAQANQELAAIDLSSTIISAPQAGIVGNRTVQVGQLVRPGTALMYLIPQTMWVEANFKETQLENMRVGQKVKVSVDALGGHDVAGKVVSFAPASGAEFSILPPENATGNFTKVVRRVPVRIELQADEQVRSMLRPGLSVVATVDTRE